MNSENEKRPAPATILVADDNLDDLFLITLALRRAGIENPVHSVCSGADAIAYMEGNNPYEGAPLPAALLLDVHLPGKNGFDVLEWLRHRQLQGKVKTVVCTGSSHPREIELAYKLGADHVMEKPGDYRDYVDFFQERLIPWLVAHQPESEELPA